ncbi:MAG: hypothetical protein P8168_12865 [Deltaproteobacteria bacterium]|jgi:hypothetical protein
MKRLVPFLILAAFILGISSGGVSRSHVTLKIRTYPQGCLQFSQYLPFDDVSGNWDTADQTLLLSGDLVSSLKPASNNLFTWNRPCPISSTDLSWQGLGCGGLPS